MNSDFTLEYVAELIAKRQSKLVDLGATFMFIDFVGYLLFRFRNASAILPIIEMGALTYVRVNKLQLPEAYFSEIS